MRAGRLLDRVDTIILPDGPARAPRRRPRARTIPEQYVGRARRAGLAALQAFVHDGGTLVCLDSSCGLAIDALRSAGAGRRAGAPTGKVLLPRIDPPAQARCARTRWLSGSWKRDRGLLRDELRIRGRSADQDVDRQRRRSRHNGNSPYDVRPVALVRQRQPADERLARRAGA